MMMSNLKTVLDKALDQIDSIEDTHIDDSAAPVLKLTSPVIKMDDVSKIILNPFPSRIHILNHLMDLKGNGTLFINLEMSQKEVLERMRRICYGN